MKLVTPIIDEAKQDFYMTVMPRGIDGRQKGAHQSSWEWFKKWFGDDSS